MQASTHDSAHARESNQVLQCDCVFLLLQAVSVTSAIQRLQSPLYLATVSTVLLLHPPPSGWKFYRFHSNL